jgi:hypothetical protein
MREHIIRWSSSLGIAMIAMVVGVMCNLRVAPLPGEDVSDGVAQTVRGGDCFSTAIVGSCDFANNKVYCDPPMNTVTCVKVTTAYMFTGVTKQGEKPDPNSNKCCGTDSTSCSMFSTKKLACGS